MLEFGSRTRTLPPPPHVVWESLTEPRRPGARPWLDLLADETDPAVLTAVAPHLVMWSSLWPARPDVRLRFDLAPAGGGTALRFTLLTPGPPPDESAIGHLRYRVNTLLFANLRYSYGN
ncbi:hypothetical protein ACFYTQ_36165 [Nocardia sp. NPDC004068]|uniref:hypothetical protein n=1 Tax=Nocardia sp. NPDC004068 TaxID=3364303 RepID=UPI0036879BC5